MESVGSRPSLKALSNQEPRQTGSQRGLAKAKAQTPPKTFKLVGYAPRGCGAFFEALGGDDERCGTGVALVLPRLCREATASVLAVPTSRAAGASGIMTEGEDAFVIEDGRDIAALAVRMKELLDTSLRRRI